MIKVVGTLTKNVTAGKDIPRETFFTFGPLDTLAFKGNSHCAVITGVTAGELYNGEVLFSDVVLYPNVVIRLEP